MARQLLATNTADGRGAWATDRYVIKYYKDDWPPGIEIEEIRLSISEGY